MASVNAAILTGPDSSLTTGSPKRIAIVDAAAELFLNSGYDTVSMDAIAEAAKVSKRTVYSHFNNKETLFGAVMQTMCDRFSGLDPSGELPSGPPEEVLRAIGTSFVAIITSPEAVAVHRIVTSEAPRHPELAEVYYANGCDHFCGMLGRYFEEQTKKGVLEVDDPITAANQFWELVKSPFHMKLLLGLAERPDEAAITDSVEATVDAFLRMYRPAA
jgi:TetR/AcrR family transcriptional repressor of mexJK operon